jgi:hypothetical protein
MLLRYQGLMATAKLDESAEKTAKAVAKERETCLREERGLNHSLSHHLSAILTHIDFLQFVLTA